jgi:aspartate oxidase
MRSCGRGDGIAAAYRAEAEMRNAEFSSFTNMIYTANHAVAMNSERFMYNAKGENFTGRYSSSPQLDIC